MSLASPTLKTGPLTFILSRSKGGLPQDPPSIQTFTSAFFHLPQGTPGPIGVPGPAGPKGERVSAP